MIQEIVVTFLVGLATPLTALCVIPLYPSFLKYLSDQIGDKESLRNHLIFGSTVVAGIITFMMFVGIIFTTILQVSITSVIEVVSPIVFALLGIMGLVMLFDLGSGKFIPQVTAPEFENPFLNGFSFGFFFGGIIIPCNPALIALFFSRSLLIQSPFNSMLNFLAFGLGIGAPLLVMSALSGKWNQKIMNFLTQRKKLINRITGLILVIVAVYYLFFVFKIGGGII